MVDALTEIKKYRPIFSFEKTRAGGYGGCGGYGFEIDSLMQTVANGNYYDGLVSELNDAVDGWINNNCDAWLRSQ